MRHVSVRWWLSAALMSTAGLVYAQESEPMPSAQSAGSVEVVDSLEDVPDEEKRERVEEHVTRMRQILSEVLDHLREARKDRDVVKLNCVNEKLTAVKGLLKAAEQASVALQEALARQDTDVAAHQFEKISIAGRKSEQALVESEACVGELAVYAGETEVVVEIQGDVSTDDPTELEEKAPIVNRPPAASPYQ